jgi:hypothetical protein
MLVQREVKTSEGEKGSVVGEEVQDGAKGREEL